MCSANLPDKIAIAVDAQMDDGDGQKGTCARQKQARPEPDRSSTPRPTHYTEDGVSTLRSSAAQM